MTRTLCFFALLLSAGLVGCARKAPDAEDSTLGGSRAPVRITYLHRAPAQLYQLSFLLLNNGQLWVRTRPWSDEDIADAFRYLPFDLTRISITLDDPTEQIPMAVLARALTRILKAHELSRPDLPLEIGIRDKVLQELFQPPLIVLGPDDPVPAFDAHVTWQDWPFDGDITKVKYLWNGKPIGQGADGVRKLAEQMRKLPDRAVVLVYPHLGAMELPGQLPRMQQVPFEVYPEFEEVRYDKRLTLIHSYRDPDGKLVETWMTEAMRGEEAARSRENAGVNEGAGTVGSRRLTVRAPEGGGVVRIAASVSRSLAISGLAKDEIEAVSFELHEVSDDDLAALRTLPRLQRVAVCGSNTTDATVVRVAALADLREASFYGTRITDAGLRALGTMKKLEALSVSDGWGGISDAGVAALGELAGLRKLRLGGRTLGDEALASVARLTSVRVLVLSAGRVTDAGLSHLRKLEALEELELWCPSVTGAGWAHLTELKSLRRLVLASPASDAGLEHLKGLTQLESLTLRLSGRDVSDGGMQHLMKLKSLRSLDLRDTGVTKGAVEQLRKALPECTIVGSASLRDDGLDGPHEPVEVCGARGRGWPGRAEPTG